MTTDTSWLDTPAISSGKKLPNERQRAPSMSRGILGKKRVWASDGEFVYFRRAKSNPATLQRHEAFLKTGDYQHVETQDDVEIYKLMPSSPFARRQRNLAELDDYNVRRQAALAACRREWGLFIDALEELSGRIKSRWAGAMATTVYDENLTAIFLAIDMRGGPSKAEIDREFAAARQRRGADRKRLLVPAVLAA